jgi:hypothetical protein
LGFPHLEFGTPIQNLDFGLFNFIFESETPNIKYLSYFTWLVPKKTLFYNKADLIATASFIEKACCPIRAFKLKKMLPLSS